MDTDTIKVLLVDDDLGDYEMTRAMLARAEHGSFKLDWVSTFEEGVDAFRAGEHDVYLVDYFLEDRTGMDLLAEAGRRGLEAPVIMLTGRGSHQVDLEAMRAGAADYLVKGQIEPEDLERSIRYALERSRSARALRESEERHRGMFDHLPVGLFRILPDGTHIDANPALIRILGFPDREAMQRLYASHLFVHPDDGQRFRGLLDRYGVVRSFETTLRRQDGESMRVRNTARLHRDPDGKVLYLEGTVEDITREKAAEEMRGSEARFRAVLQNARTGIALLGLDGAILEANPAFWGLFHLGPRDLDGLPFPDLLGEEDRPGVLRELEALARGDTDRTEGARRLRRRDEEEVWGRAVACLVRNQEGEPEQILVLVDDVAEAGGARPS